MGEKLMFASDYMEYMEGCHPEILERLGELNHAHMLHIKGRTDAAREFGRKA